MRNIEYDTGKEDWAVNKLRVISTAWYSGVVQVKGRTFGGER